MRPADRGTPFAAIWNDRFTEVEALGAATSLSGLSVPHLEPVTCEFRRSDREGLHHVDGRNALTHAPFGAAWATGKAPGLLATDPGRGRRCSCQDGCPGRPSHSNGPSDPLPPVSGRAVEVPPGLMESFRGSDHAEGGFMTSA